MIVVTVFLSILNQMEIHLIQNRKENSHQDYIPFNVKGNEIGVFSVYGHMAGNHPSRPVAPNPSTRLPFLQPAGEHSRSSRHHSGLIGGPPEAPQT